MLLNIASISLLKLPKLANLNVLFSIDLLTKLLVQLQTLLPISHVNLAVSRMLMEIAMKSVQATWTLIFLTLSVFSLLVLVFSMFQPLLVWMVLGNVLKTMSLLLKLAKMLVL